MSWINSLYITYQYLLENNVDKLIPIAHSTRNTHLEVTIDTDGDFISATFIPKNESETLIPVTQESDSRAGSSVFPHPLCDKLQYLAGDYEKYIEPPKKDFYGQYMAQLKNWHESDYTTPKVDAIYKYLSKGKIISDLVRMNIFSTDEKAHLTEKWENCHVPLSAGAQKDAFIRFRVSGDDYISGVWQDKKLQKKWTDYYLNSQTKKELCYVSGETTLCATSFPKKIRHSGDMAKLISSNDTSGFTFRGRFAQANEAVNIGYEVSQKAHNALKYLIGKQGYRIGERVFLLWGTKGEDTPELACNTDEFSQNNDTFGGTKEDCAKRLELAMKGYRAQIDFDTKLIFLGIDAATTGRMAIVTYNEYIGTQATALLERIKSWHTVGAWQHEYKKFIDKEKTVYFGIPSPRAIAEAAYGVNQGGILKVGNDKLTAGVVSRLLSCITGTSKIPRDIVNMLLMKSSQPQNYENFFQWERVLATTCSLYAKYLHDYEGKDVDMNIDENSTSMDYILGRMLSLLHTIELWVLLDRNEGGSGVRTTNAMRYFTRFMHDPANTYKVIYNNVLPYRQKLGGKGGKLYSLLEELSAKIDAEEFKNARNLDGRFILGFDSQLKNIPKTNKENESTMQREEK